MGRMPQHARSDSTGPWTPAVHALLTHLESHGVAAPRALRFDECGREILSFVPGDVIWPGHVELVRKEVALESLGRSILACRRAAHGAQPDDLAGGPRLPHAPSRRRD